MGNYLGWTDRIRPTFKLATLRRERRCRLFCLRLKTKWLKALVKNIGVSENLPLTTESKVIPNSEAVTAPPTRKNKSLKRTLTPHEFMMLTRQFEFTKRKTFHKEEN